MTHESSEPISADFEEDELYPDYIIPSVFDGRVAKVVAKAASDAASATDAGRSHRFKSHD